MKKQIINLLKTKEIKYTITNESDNYIRVEVGRGYDSIMSAIADRLGNNPKVNVMTIIANVYHFDF